MDSHSSASEPFRVHHLPVSALALPGRLGLASAPGAGGARPQDPGRDLETDLGRIRRTYVASVLVCLFEEHELERLGIRALVRAAEALSMEVLELPIVEGGAPEWLGETTVLVERVLEVLAAGQNVVLLGREGMGRPGLVASACLVARGHSIADAFQAVHAACGHVVRSPAQAGFVADFAEHWRVQMTDRSTSPETERGPPLQSGYGIVPLLSRFRGCLLGGAVGDALGFPVEFVTSVAAIRAAASEQPPAGLGYRLGPPARISDDTQMTLFVAEGLVRARQQELSGGRGDEIRSIQQALLRWLLTQESIPGVDELVQSGWLWQESRLREQRAPGNTNLAALRAQAREYWLPDRERPPNNSRGSGALVRSAPIGLFATSREAAFELARDAALLTHGNPNAYLPAACLAALIHDLARDLPPGPALDAVEGLLTQSPGSLDTLRGLERARELAATGAVGPESIERLGRGWVGNEALSIAVACLLSTDGADSDDFAWAVWRAVLHGGDSDSTASVTGNLLGAWRGEEVIRTRWLEEIELRDVVVRMAEDLYASSVLGTHFDRETYPPAIAFR